MMIESGTVTRTLEGLKTADLLLEWKEITHALVGREHTAELYQELAHQSGYVHPSGNPALKSASHHRGPIRSDNLQSVPDSTDVDGAIKESADEDDVASTSRLDESDIDVDLYDEINVPSHLIDEAADLSGCRNSNPPSTFEEIFAQESELARHNMGEYLPDGVLRRLSDTPCSPIFPSVTDLNQPLNVDPDPAPELGSVLTAERRDGIDSVNETKAASTPIYLPPGCPKRSRARVGLRVSDKRNLAQTQIPIVVDLLLDRDVISSFLENCHLIYESWIPCSGPRAEACNDNLETSVSTALKTVQCLSKGNWVYRLLSRFASIQFLWLFEAYEATVATKDRGVGHVTVAINTYTEYMLKTSSEAPKRNHLLECRRTGRRWELLAGRAPILALIFPGIADTIVYVLFPSLLMRLMVWKAESFHYRFDSPSSGSANRAKPWPPS